MVEPWGGKEVSRTMKWQSMERKGPAQPPAKVERAHKSTGGDWKGSHLGYPRTISEASFKSL